MAEIYRRSSASTARIARWAIYATVLAMTRAVGSPGLAHAEGPAALPACSSETLRAFRESGAKSAYETAATPGASVQTLGDGGKIYSYGLGATTVEYPIPPRSFDPKTAPAAQLERYDFPPRPADPEARTAWDQTFANGYEPVPPGGCVSDDYAGVAEIVGGPSEGVFGSEDVESLNWSGFAASAQGHPSHFGGVTGQYSQPAYHGDVCGNGVEFSWTGLGGLYSSSLIQAGTALTSAPEYWAWYEYLPNPSVRVSLTVKAGDLITDYVAYSGGTADFWVLNSTRGLYSHTTLTGMSGYYNGSSADFIDERPRVGGSYTNLANFEKVNWGEAKVVNNVSGAVEPLGSAEHVRLHMWNNAGTHQLAAPGLLSSGTSFQDNWLACQ
jgi:hypothetical protein